MITTVELSSWSEFEKIVAENLLEETRELRTGPYCFRGHANADWHLNTTLERSVGLDRAVRDYYMNIKHIQSEIETFTDRSWDLPSNLDYDDQTIRNEKVLQYLKYLRHFGYPSPLLDWTFSPFVAAYFAFRDITNVASSVAIYSLLVASEMGQGPRDGTPYIYPVLGSSRRNKRHYLQQSFYTICLKGSKNDLCFASHEDPAAMGSEDGPSGVPIRKYILASTERVTALHSLEAYNINGYSLMGTEESLLETLFLREYKTREINKRISANWFNS